MRFNYCYTYYVVYFVLFIHRRKFPINERRFESVTLGQFRSTVKLVATLERDVQTENLKRP